MTEHPLRSNPQLQIILNLTDLSNFSGIAEELTSIDRVNQWCATATDGKITSIISGGCKERLKNGR
eukprot:11974088-Ditylum_brightwellii.AAC.1